LGAQESQARPLDVVIHLGRPHARPFLRHLCPASTSPGWRIHLRQARSALGMATRGADSIPYRILTTAIPSARAAPARGRSGPPHRPSAPGAGPARPRQQLVRTPDDPARGDLARRGRRPPSCSRVHARRDRSSGYREPSRRLLVGCGTVSRPSFTPRREDQPRDLRGGPTTLRHHGSRRANDVAIPSRHVESLRRLAGAPPSGSARRGLRAQLGSPYFVS
jgi:hypothetical protein